ncbi:MAG: DUF1302 family protein [Gammaproteobacteria bacterium]|nr:DUF1302 family protein [Gammaproteobacteria bacterium]
MVFQIGAAAILLLTAFSASAFNFSLADIEGSLDTSLSIGGRWRIESQDRDLIARNNLDTTLCPRSTAQCLLGGHKEFIQSPGSLNALLDNGNLNYDKGDAVQGMVKGVSSLSLNWQNFVVNVRGYAFYDWVNTDFVEFHPNGLSNDGEDDGRTPAANPEAFQYRFQNRVKESTDSIGIRAEILDANIVGEFEIGEHLLTIGYGEQLLSWGESFLLPIGSINSINPPSVNRLFTPSFDPSELFEPVEMLTAGYDLTENLSAEAFIQFDFEPLDIPPRGSYYSPLDIVGPGASYLMLSSGKSPDDPSNAADTLNPLAFLSGARPTDEAIQAGCINSASINSESNGSTIDHYSKDPDPTGDTNTAVPYADRGGVFGRTSCVLDDIHPDPDGQWGLSFKWYSEALNDTEFGFYFSNYHSRLPLGGVYAASRGNSDGQPLINGVSTAIQGITDLLPIGTPDLELVPVLNGIAVVDTISASFAYPKNIRMYGLSFNTTLGDISISGELAHRENLPIQVIPNDVFHYGTATAFQSARGQATPSCLELYRNPNYNGACVAPENNYEVPAAALDVLSEAPTGRAPAGDRRNLDAAIDGNPSEQDWVALNPGDYIPGWERFPSTNGSLVALYVPENNPFGADQWVIVNEVGFTKIHNMPDPSVLPFLTNAVETHVTIGRSECEQQGGCYGDTTEIVAIEGQGPNNGSYVTAIAIQNDQRQKDGFATSFSWGIRNLNLLTYNNLLPSTNLKLLVGLFLDVNGRSPEPGGNFSEGRKQFLVNATFERPSFNYIIGWEGATGGGSGNLFNDRDNITMAISYEF